LHLALLLVLINHRDGSPAILSYSAPYAALLVLVASTGLLGAIAVMARDSIHLPRGLTAFRSGLVVRVVGLLLGTAAIAAIWTMPFQNIALSQVQQEALRGWGTLVVWVVVYAALFWKATTTVLPWSAWVVATTLIGAVVVILTVHYLDRFPQIN